MDLTSQVMVLTDLDDTLFQTARKLPLRQKPAEQAINVVQEDRGVKATFMLERQHTLLQWLSMGNVVPVTGRDLRGFAALQLSWGSHAILNHGATVLHQTDTGWVPDPEWTLHMQEQAKSYQPLLQDALSHLEAFCPSGEGMFHRIIEQDGLPICTVSKVRSLPEAHLQDLHDHVQEQLQGTDCYVHLNGNNLSFIPHAVRKLHAVKHVMGLCQPRLTLGVGDSHTDLEFMAACDFWMTPSGSQIQRLLEPAHV